MGKRRQIGSLGMEATRIQDLLPTVRKNHPGWLTKSARGTYNTFSIHSVIQQVSIPTLGLGGTVPTQRNKGLLSWNL